MIETKFTNYKCWHMKSPLQDFRFALACQPRNRSNSRPELRHLPGLAAGAGGWVRLRSNRSLKGRRSRARRPRRFRPSRSLCAPTPPPRRTARLYQQRERVHYGQPTGPNPLNHRDDFSRPALRDGRLNSLFCRHALSSAPGCHLLPSRESALCWPFGESV